MSEAKIRILVADDELLIQQAFKDSLDAVADFDVVGVAGTGPLIEHLVKERKPDILMLDIQLQGGEDGIAICEKLNADPDVATRIVFVTSHATPENFKRAREAGGCAFISKDDGRDRLLDVIRTVHAVGSVIETQQFVANESHKISSLIDHEDATAPEALKSLSKRELEILQFVARGKQNKYIACELKISEHTVRNHISNVFQKLDVSNRTEAGFAVRNLLN